MFRVKNKKSLDLGIAKFIAVRPWMMEYEWASAQELYVFAYIWNCNDHFGQLRMDTQSDLNRCSTYINLDPEVISKCIENLLIKNYIDTNICEDETYLIVNVGSEWFGYYEGFSK